MEYLIMPDNNIVSYSMKNIVNETKGRKFTTGTVTFATSLSQQVIYHNLGVKPSYFCLYPLFEPNFDKITSAYAAYQYVYFKGTGHIPELSEKADFWIINPNNGLTVYNGNPYEFDNNAINEEYVKTRTLYALNNYSFEANKEFGWIAIE